MTLTWDPDARDAFEEAIAYLQERSPQAAAKFAVEVNAATLRLLTYPLMHRADPDRLANDGSYRRFYVQRYAISYTVSDDEIIIVRFRHSKREPLFY